MCGSLSVAIVLVFSWAAAGVAGMHESASATRRQAPEATHGASQRIARVLTEPNSATVSEGGSGANGNPAQANGSSPEALPKPVYPAANSTALAMGGRPAVAGATGRCSGVDDTLLGCDRAAGPCAECGTFHGEKR